MNDHQEQPKHPPGKKKTIGDQAGWLVVHTIKGHRYYYLHIYDPETQKTNKIKYVGRVDKVDAGESSPS